MTTPLLSNLSQTQEVMERMSTTIHSLPFELIELILYEVATISLPQEIFWCCLVTRSWTPLLLPQLYKRVVLSSERSMRSFANCPVKHNYSIYSLSLPALALWTRDAVESLFQLCQLEGQEIKELTLGGGGGFPNQVLSLPAFQGE